MDDNIALIGAFLAGGSLAVGVAAETAFHEYSHNKLEKITGDSDRMARLSARLKNFGRLALSLSMFNGLSAALMVGFIFLYRSPSVSWVVDLQTMIIAVVLAVLVLGGLARGLVARAPELTLLRLFGFILFVQRVMRPVTGPIGFICRNSARLLGLKEPDDKATDEALEEILDAVAEGEAEGALEEDAAEYIENIMEYRDRVVREVMTPRTALICGAHDMTFAAAVGILNQYGHSRLPIYEESRDNIIGILYFKDVLSHYEDAASGRFDVKKLIREPLLVPETKKINELLAEFKERKVHIAIVLDEFGGTAGLVTVEDILEEIVGELEDEFDPIPEINEIARLDDNAVEVDAKIPIDYLNEQLSIAIPENGDYDTIGGFLSAQMGKVPAKGENYEMEGVAFEVTDADDRRVKRIKVKVG